MSHPSPFAIERLEDRCVPATFGVPWADPRHLTLSFAPDGTSTSSGASNLFQAFGAQLPQSVWQGEILQAVQTWASVANLNVGVVPDGGEAFGAAGAVQGDSRFGDIRIGGVPMPGYSLALTTPPDPFLGGTLGGDIVLNTAINPADPNYNLYSVALHEVGHALGLADSTDPTSVMFGNLQQLPDQLSAGDVAAIQALYGPPAVDPNAVPSATSAPSQATGLVPSTASVASGRVPLVAYGDLTAAGTADAFSFQVPAGYAGPMTVRVRTAGISLLEPTVNLYDPTGALVATGSVTDPSGGEIILPVSAVSPGGTYSLQISGASPFGTGRYALAVSFGHAVQVSPTRLESVLQGPYDTWAATDVANLLVGVKAPIAPAAHTTPATALALTTPTGTGPLPTYQTTGVLHGEGALVYYQVVTPNTSAPVTLTVAVAGFDDSGGSQRVQVFDSQNLPVRATVQANGEGTYSIQAGGLVANQVYYLRVSAGEDSQGGYELTADFNQAPALLGKVSSGQLTSTTPTVGQTLFVAVPQYFLISLGASVGGEDEDSTATIQMTVADATGAVVFSLSAGVGQSAASGTVLLAPGQYTVQYTVQFPAPATGPAPGITQPLNFVVRLASLADPVGPKVIDPTDVPLYQDPTDPTQFLYPVGVLTSSVFYWFPALV
jgi:hypothetical protein